MCCTQYASKFGKCKSDHKTGKGQSSFEYQRRAMPKNFQTSALISHAGKVMLKILQARLQQYMNCEVPDVQAGFRKGRGTRDQIANIHGIIKQRNSRIRSTSASLTMLKLFTVWITMTGGNSSRDGHTRSLCLPPEKPVCRSKSNIWNNTWNNWFKIGKTVH